MVPQAFPARELNLEWTFSTLRKRARLSGLAAQATQPLVSHLILMLQIFRTLNLSLVYMLADIPLIPPLTGPSGHGRTPPPKGSHNHPPPPNPAPYIARSHSPLPWG